MVEDDENADGEAPSLRDSYAEKERERRLDTLLRLPVLTLSDVADLVGISLRTIWKMRAEGIGPRSFSIGARHFVTRESFDEWISILDRKGDDD